MLVIAVTVGCLATYALAYRLYGRFLGQRVFALDPQRQTPAVAHRDGVDYVPTRKPVVFGHHWASITGLAPMLGGAVLGSTPMTVWRDNMT